MNSIIEQFGKKKQQTYDIPPHAPMPSSPKPDPKHAEAITFVSDLAAQVQHLQSENATLSQQLSVALELGNEFRRLHDIDRIELERWRTYAVEARTFFQTFYDLAKRAHSKAQDAANGENINPDAAAGLKAIDAALKPEAPSQ